QVGLSTIESFCDGRHCSLSQSISWKSQTEPLYKEVNPQVIFDQLAGTFSGGLTGEGTPTDEATTEAARRRALDQSVLDAVLENATHTRARLGSSDRQRLDQFLESVREVELQVQSTGQVTPGVSISCSGERPELGAGTGLANGQDGY